MTKKAMKGWKKNKVGKSLKEERELKSLYLSVMHVNKSLNRYLINYQPNSEGTAVQFTVFRADKLNEHQKTLYHHYAPVALKSKIYFIGGTLEMENINSSYPAAHNKVSLYDTNSGQMKPFAKMMKLPRNSHVATVTSSLREIFVFGHRNDINLAIEDWAEYYNPRNNYWRRLPRPPPIEVYNWRGSPDGIALHEPTKTIYLWKAFKGFYSYNYRSSEWKDMSKNIPCSFGSVVVGNVLFWHYKHKIYAYDLVDHTMLPNPSDYPEDLDVSLNFTQLVHLQGGLLCLLSCIQKDGEIQCDTYRIDFNGTPGEGSPRFSHPPVFVGTENLYIGTEISCIVGALMLTRNDQELKTRMQRVENEEDTDQEDKAGKMQRVENEEDKNQEDKAGKMHIKDNVQEDNAGEMQIMEKEEHNDGKMEVEEQVTEMMFMLITLLGIRRVGGILSAFERKGFKLTGLKLMDLDLSTDEDLCVFEPYDEYVRSGSVVAITWVGINAVTEVINTMGFTDNLYDSWIINVDEYPMAINRDMIYYSDSVERATKDIAFWFPESFPINFNSGNFESDKKFNMDLAFIIIEKTSVEKGYVGDIIHIFQKKGFSLKGLKLTKDPKTSFPVVAMILHGRDVVKHIQKTVDEQESGFI